VKHYPKISLCISTYNWPQALELCLESTLIQTHRPDEIVIGDDGSLNDTTIVIEEFRKKCDIPILHVWQPDEGFKLAQIRNKSFAASSKEYIIQIDGDVILHKHFIEDHLTFAKRNVFISGTRCLLTANSTPKMLGEKLLYNVAKRYELEKRYNAYRLPVVAYLNFQLQKGISQTKYVLGANMSFWRHDLVSVNGYNEDYSGWGKEDNDLAVRLVNSGIQIHSLRFAGIIYHLKHNESSKDLHERNKILLDLATKEKQTFVTNGMNKYLN
jgi:glycosyltransferase involved in cell wall biosynthesis